MRTEYFSNYFLYYWYFFITRGYHTCRSAIHFNLKPTYGSDAFDQIYLGKSVAFLHKSAKNDYLNEYKNRHQEFKDITTISEYSEKQDLCHRRKDQYYSPIYTGACTAPLFPSKKELAKSLTFTYKPWHGYYFYFDDSIIHKNLERFIKRSIYKQITKTMECVNEVSNEHQELLHFGHLHNEYDNDQEDDANNVQLNFGLNYKWDKDKDVSIFEKKFRWQNFFIEKSNNISNFRNMLIYQMGNFG